MKNPQSQMAQLATNLRELGEKDLITPCDYQGVCREVSDEIIYLNETGRDELSAEEGRHLDMLLGVHNNLSDIMREVSDLIRSRLYDAQTEAEWHLSLTDGLKLIEGKK